VIGPPGRSAPLHVPRRRPAAVASSFTYAEQSAPPARSGTAVGVWPSQTTSASRQGWRVSGVGFRGALLRAAEAGLPCRASRGRAGVFSARRTWRESDTRRPWRAQTVGQRRISPIADTLHCGPTEMIELHAIRKAFNQGHDNEYWALDGIDLSIEAQQGHRPARPQRLGQDHAADHHRLPGAADRGPRAPGRRGHLRAARALPDRDPPQALRLHLPAVQPDQGPHGAGQHHPAGLSHRAPRRELLDRAEELLAGLKLGHRRAPRWNGSPAANSSAWRSAVR
jgi:hypothetical protein